MQKTNLESNEVNQYATPFPQMPKKIKLKQYQTFNSQIANHEYEIMSLCII